MIIITKKLRCHTTVNTAIAVGRDYDVVGECDKFYEIINDMGYSHFFSKRKSTSTDTGDIGHNTSFEEWFELIEGDSSE